MVPNDDEAGLRVAAIQMPHGETLDANITAARRLLGEAQQRGVALALLPEYFFMASDTQPAMAAAAVRELIATESDTSGMIIAANVIEEQGKQHYNVGLVYAAGREVLAQPKLHPMPRETKEGIAPGDALVTRDIGGVRIGFLVCSDILYPEAARMLALQRADLILNPVMSRHMQDDPTLTARESMYIARAYDSAAFVLKAGGHRRADPAIAGRSLVAAPWGIIGHYQDEFGSEVLVADLDLHGLAAFREAQRRFPPRRPEVYRPLVETQEGS